MKRSYTLFFMILVTLAYPAQSRMFQVRGGREPAPPPTPPPSRTPRPTPTRGNPPRRFVNVIIVSSTPTPGGPSGATVPLPDCEVLLDGKSLEKLTDAQGRLVIPMAPGSTHEVEVSKYGFVIAGPVEVVASGDNKEVSFILTRELRSLKVKTNEPHVKVTLDGGREAESDDQGWLTFKKVDPSITHKLRGSKDDFHDETVDVVPYQAEALLRLKRALHPLRVQTIPPEADVYLDDKPKGKSDARGFLDIAKVESGREYSLRAEKPGYVTKTETVPADHEAYPITLPLNTPTPTPIPAPATTTTPAPTPIPTADDSEFKKLLKEGRLARAVDVYASLASSEPQNPSLTGYLDELLRALRERTSAALAHVDPYGLNVPVGEARELSELYERVRKWRPGDQGLQALAEYWTAKYWQAGAQLIASQGGREVYLQKARTAAQDAGAFNPQDAKVLFDLGCLYVALGDTATAAKYFEDARSLDDGWAYPLFALGTIDMRAAEAEVAKARKSARYEQAVDNFTKAITLDPAFRQAYELRCIAYAVVNRHQESVASGQQAVALKPASAYAHYALGFAYYQFGVDKDKKQYRNAINEFDLALTLTDDALDATTAEGVRQKLAVMKKALGIKPQRQG